MFRRPELKLRGQWVLVTGASSGLGAAIVRELASVYGANVLMVARRKTSLDALARDIETAFHVKAVAICGDLSVTADVANVIAAIRPYAPVAAVLSAAMTHNAYFSEETLQQSRAVMATNIMGMTSMLAHIVDLFAPSTERRAILVISSIAGEVSLPHQAVYAASKSYASTLVQSVAQELAASNVSLGAFLPGGIDTDMARSSNLDPTSWSARYGLMPPAECARLAVKALISGRLISVPGFLNKIVYGVSSVLPRALMARLAAMPYRLPPR